MREYVYPIHQNELQVMEYDVVVVGEGLAGLYGALNINEQLSVAVLSKSVNETNSYLSQGGVAAVLDQKDSVQSHIDDTLIAGAGFCNEEAVDLLCKEGPEEIRKLLEWDVPFDRQKNGQIAVTLEGGHSSKRILHCGGDKTGREIVNHLQKLIGEKDHITEIHHSYIVDVLTAENQVTGILIYNKHKLRLIRTSFVILATGGIGALYPFSTNPDIVIGDGIAAAKRAGAALKDMEFVQFHPTSYYNEEDVGKCFLISEAVRGEGGILRNEDGKAFMSERHIRKDLAPRDIVAREITKEMKKRNMPYVYLDITHQSERYLSRRFPTIFSHCLANGVNMAKDWIRVRPVQHYFMGGIATDLNGMTNIQGLYACGETACTGVHGANRLASNSLLECLVFSRRSAEHIGKSFDHSIKKFVCDVTKFISESGDLDKECLKTIQRNIRIVMDKSGGIARNETDMRRGINTLEKIEQQLKNHVIYSREYIKALNMVQVGLEVLKAACARRESAGAHYRTDGLKGK